MIEIVSVNVMQKKSLEALVTVKFPKMYNLIVTNIGIFNGGDKKWVSLPSYKTMTEDKPKYLPYVKFEDFAMDKRVKDQILIAYEEYVSKNKKAVDEERARLSKDQKELEGELPF